MQFPDRSIKSTLLAGCIGAALLAPGVALAQALTCTGASNSVQAYLLAKPEVKSFTITGGGTNTTCAITNIIYRDRSLSHSGTGTGPGSEALNLGHYGPGAYPTSNTTVTGGTAGAYQHIRMAINLPGTDLWNGRAVQSAGGLDQGSVGPSGVRDMSSYPIPRVDGFPATATTAIGLSTDSGHGDANSGSGDAYGYVQGERPNYGKLKDWAGGRSYCTAVKLAKELAMLYYGQPIARTYWEGFSGGGQMGMTQVQNCPEEYHGVLAGAPSMHWQQFRLNDSYQAMVMKKAQLLGIPFSSGQVTSAHTAAIAFCMTRGPGGVVIGTTNTLHDPRSCDWKASMHVCGQPTAPAAPNCLTAGTRQAELLQQVIDGPTNTYGKRIYYPVSFGVNFSNSTSVFALSTPQVVRWNHFSSTVVANNVLFLDQESIALAGNPPGAISYTDEMALGTERMSDLADTNNPHIDSAKTAGLKIMHYHGTHDNLIGFRKDPAYYREVATYFGGGVTDYDGLRQWYRFYLTPGSGHEANAQWLSNLVSWVEGQVPPDKLTRNSAQRAICPYPQFAQYQGGSTTDANNYVCGGNLEDNLTAYCSMVKTTYKGEKGPITNTVELGLDPRKCQAKR